MKYTPHTAEDIARALDAIGVNSVEDLFEDLPEAMRNPRMDLNPALDEWQLTEHMRALSQKNTTQGPNFLGGGMGKHFIPSVVDALTFQSEFVTAYTPYQPEVSQGGLQAMFEYQSMICELTGLDVSNSSLYDGATAVAEAALLALRHTGKDTIVLSQGIHPEYRETIQTFLEAVGAHCVTLELKDGQTENPNLGDGVAAFIVQSPNFLGSIEEMAQLSQAAHSAGALFIAVTDPLSLALLCTPGSYQADIAVGDGQSIGNAMNFGGPSYGFIAVKEALTRQLPGRLVGMTHDLQGKRGFVLTLQAREQHIRRAKAKSNICSNHALMALQSAIYLSALGPQGLREAATVSVRRAHELQPILGELGLKSLNQSYFFNEFAVSLPMDPATVRLELARRGVHACVPIPLSYGLGHAGLFSATELTTPEDIARLTQALQEILPC